MLIILASASRVLNVLTAELFAHEIPGGMFLWVEIVIVVLHHTGCQLDYLYKPWEFWTDPDMQFKASWPVPVPGPFVYHIISTLQVEDETVAHVVGPVVYHIPLPPPPLHLHVLSNFC